MTAIIVDFKTGRRVRSVRRAKAPTPATLRREERLARALEALRGVCCTFLGEAGAIAFYDLAPVDQRLRAAVVHDAAMKAIGIANETLAAMRRGPWERQPGRGKGA